MEAIGTKEIILEKTFKLLLIKGYDAVSISDIQKATGMARGLLYHYFGSKEKLFVEVTQKYFVNFFHIEMKTIQEFDIKQMIVYIIDKYSEICSGHLGDLEDISIMNYDFLFYRVMQEDEIFAKKYLKEREQELIAWEIVLENSQKKGRLRHDLNIKNIARHFTYLMDGVWMNAVNKGKITNLIDDLREVLDEFYKLIRK